MASATRSVRFRPPIQFIQLYWRARFHSFRFFETLSYGTNLIGCWFSFLKWQNNYYQERLSASLDFIRFECEFSWATKNTFGGYLWHFCCSVFQRPQEGRSKVRRRRRWFKVLTSDNFCRHISYCTLLHFNHSTTKPNALSSLGRVCVWMRRCGVCVCVCALMQNPFRK